MNGSWRNWKPFGNCLSGMKIFCSRVNEFPMRTFLVEYTITKFSYRASIWEAEFLSNELRVLRALHLLCIDLLGNSTGTEGESVFRGN